MTRPVGCLVMRRGLVVLLALLMIPISMGEQVDAIVVTDGTGDVVIMTPDGGAPQSDGGLMPNTDIVEAGILAETKDDITFYVKVQGLETNSQNPLPFSDPDYRVYFRYGEQGYRVRLDTALTNVFNDAMGRSGTIFAALEAEVGGGSYRNLASADATLEYNDNRVVATVPRAAIVDHNQAPLGLGRVLEGFYATAQSMGQFAFPVGQTGQGGDPILYAGPPRAWDQAPDALTGVLPSYTMTTGEMRQKGSLVAGSDDPVRWTNGEASTLVFDVRVANNGEKEVPVTVSVKNADPKWTLAFSDSLTVKAGSATNVTVLVTIPFSHNHGALRTFDVRFDSLDGAHFASTMLGVYWPLVPQPAGHHDTLWFHSYVQTDDNNPFAGIFGSGTHAWMSALESEETDDGVPIPAQFTMPPNTFTGGKGLAYWQIPLEPALRMGLDFRTEDLGTLELAMDFPSTVVDPHISVSLRHAEVVQTQGRGGQGGTQTRDPVTLASGTAPALSGPVDGAQAFTIELGIAPEADDVPYNKDGNLFLTVFMEATFLAGFGQADPASITPAINPGASWMKLPLNEYEVPLDLTFQTDGAIELTPTEDGQQKSVNPGRTTVYAFEMVYHGTNASNFVIEVTGTHTEWASVVGDVGFSLEAHGTRKVGLAVTAPKDADVGDFADLTFTVRDSDNAAVKAGLNTRTLVVAGTEIPDESDRAKGLDDELTTAKESPGLPLLFVIAALALGLRRR